MDVRASDDMILISILFFYFVLVQVDADFNSDKKKRTMSNNLILNFEIPQSFLLQCSCHWRGGGVVGFMKYLPLPGLSW